MLRHEFHGLMVVASGAIVLDVAQESWRAGIWRADDLWLWFFAVSAILFVGSIAVKKGPRLLDIAQIAAEGLAGEPKDRPGGLSH